MKHESLWEGERMTLEESIALTLDSLRAYGARYRHWAIAYSGGISMSLIVVVYSELQIRLNHFIEGAIMNTHCVVCAEPILSHSNQRETQKTCGRPECMKEWRRWWFLAHRKAKRGQKEHDGMDMVACVVCGGRFEIIQYTHLRKHGLTVAQYMAQYPDAPLMTDRLKETRGNSPLTRSRYLTYDGKEPDDRLFEFLVGSLLGDGSLELRPSKTNARYAEDGKNEAYLQWKYELLSQYFPCTFREKLSAPHTKSGKSYHGWWIKTGVHPVLTEWHSQWYSGRKIVPFARIDSYLSDFALAVWVCDDGHVGKTSAALCTFAFSQNEVEFLSSLLKSRFDLTSVVRKNNKNQPFLWFSAKERRNLQDIIALVGIPGMEYKYARAH